MRSTLLVLFAVASWGFVHAGGAEAHSGTGGNYISTVLWIDPPIPGLTVMVVGRDARSGATLR